MRPDPSSHAARPSDSRHEVSGLATHIEGKPAWPMTAARSRCYAATMIVLATAFVAARTQPGPDLVGSILEQRLNALLQQARTVYPNVAIAPEHFAEELGRRTLADENLDQLSKRIVVADLYLAAGCLHGDSKSQSHVHGMLRNLAAVHLCKLDRSPGFADDVVQELTEHMILAPSGANQRLARYSAQGSLGAFLRVSLVRTGQDLLRRRKPEGNADAVAAPGPTPEIEHVKHRYAREFETALQSALHALQPTERAMLREHYLQSVTLEDLATRYGSSRATIARRLAATKRQIVEATLQALRLDPSSSAAPGAELLALVESRLVLSLSRHLG